MTVIRNEITFNVLSPFWTQYHKNMYYGTYSTEVDSEPVHFLCYFYSVLYSEPTQFYYSVEPTLYMVSHSPYIRYSSE